MMISRGDIVYFLMVALFGSSHSSPTPTAKPTLNPDKFTAMLGNPAYPFMYEVPPLVAYVHHLGQLRNVTFGNLYTNLSTITRGSTDYWPIQRCGVHFLNKGEGYILSHRAFDDTPTTNERCAWGFVGDRFCTPRIECPEFNHPPSFHHLYSGGASSASASCRRNYLQITDAGASFLHHFCGGERRPRMKEAYTAKDGLLDVVFRYSDPAQRPQFTCFVSCVNYPVSYSVKGSNALGSTQPLEVKVHEDPVPFQDTLPPTNLNPGCSCGVTNNPKAKPTPTAAVVQDKNNATTTKFKGRRSGGNNRVERIVGGVHTHPNQYPWSVGLLSKGSTGRLPFCGAALISSTYVLTAQHCVEDEDLEDIVVVLNEHDYHKDNETVGPSVRRGVVEMINYPYYMESTFSGDMALLRLDSPLPITTPQFTPVCLPKDRAELWVGREITATGWGTTSGGPGASKSPFLMQVPLIVYPNTACNDYHPHDPPEPPQVMDNMMCAGYSEGGRDTCAGDSGGPVTVKMPETGRHTQVGVTSWGFGCAIRLNPGVFARVSEFMYWIRMHTVDDTFCSE